MTGRLAALGLFVLSVAAGTILDARVRATLQPRDGNILVADLHVHPYPGDGSLTVRQLQREAARRGVDLVAITSHNHRLGVVLSHVLGSDPAGAIVLGGQEVTSSGYHMIAAGIDRLIDWRLPAADAAAAIHEQGGVAIAAHPIDLISAGWDPPGRAALDGTEVMHPLRLGDESGARELDVFFDATRRTNPDVAPIGSTDFHMAAPLGLCRTYILAAARSAEAALAAIRAGRTAAACGAQEVVGSSEHVATVRNALGTMPAARPPGALEKLVALFALIALGVLALPRQQ